MHRLVFKPMGEDSPKGQIAAPRKASGRCGFFVNALGIMRSTFGETTAFPWRGDYFQHPQVAKRDKYRILSCES